MDKSRIPISLLLRRFLLFGIPFILGGMEIFHPMPGTAVIASLSLHAGWWLTLHLIQLPLFGLLAVAVLALTTGLSGGAAMVSRIGVWFFIVFYLATDTLGGIANGIIVRETQNLPPEQLYGLERIVETFFWDPVVGASNSYSVFLLLGALGWLVSVVAAGVALYRAHRISWGPIVLLALSGLLFGYAHVPPTGPLGMLCFLLAVLWIEFLPKSHTD